MPVPEFDEVTFAEIRAAAQKAARQEVRTKRWFRYFMEAVVLLAVVGSLAAYQNSQNTKDRHLAEALVAQVEVARYKQAHILVVSQRKSCERDNDSVRTPLFDFLVSATNRAKGQAALDPTSAAVNLTAAAAYKVQADMMVAAAFPYRRYADRPEIACNKAFKLPTAPNQTVRDLAASAPDINGST